MNYRSDYYRYWGGGEGENDAELFYNTWRDVRYKIEARFKSSETINK